jgi:hypothetical protein
VSALPPSSSLAPPPPAPKRRNWLGRRVDAWSETARELRREPRSVARLARNAAVRLWSSRGGGFYGLGYVVTFVVLEIRTLASGFVESDDVIAHLGQEILAVFLRFAFESIGNTLLAFLWPLFVLQALSGWAIVVLAAGWWGYGRWAVPWVRSLGVESPRGKKRKERP